MTPFCTDCRRAMRCSKTGRQVLIFNSHDEPYQLFSGDEFECLGCDLRIVANFGRPLEHFDERFAAAVESARLSGNLLEEKGWDLAVVSEREAGASELVAVPYVEGDTCPRCGEDVVPNDRGGSMCPRCAEEYKQKPQ